MLISVVILLYNQSTHRYLVVDGDFLTSVDELVQKCSDLAMQKVRELDFPLDWEIKSISHTRLH